MKKFRYILSALTLLVASATAHAQVFDVTITPTDGSEVFSQTSATLIEIYPGNSSPIRVFSGADPQGASLPVAHGVRYDFALTPATTINPGSGNLPEGNFPAHAPKRKTVEEPSFTEPALEGPALVLMRDEAEPIIYYAKDATDGPIQLKCGSNGQYIVDAVVVQGTVTNVFYKDAHTPEAHEEVDATCTKAGNTAYWSCSTSGCNKYFSDKACTKVIEEDSWVIPATGHADADNNGYCDNEGCNLEMDVTVALSKVGDRYYSSFGAPYIYNVTNAGENLKVYVATSLSDGVLTMTQVGNAAIPAGKGVVIVGTSSSSPETMTATIAHATEADDVSDILGATTAGMETTGNAFFSAVNGIVGFYAYNTTLGAVPAGKAYLELPTEEADAKGFTMVFDDETTSINDALRYDNDTLRYDNIYNLNGQRLSAPQKGINIVNGKKVMVK